MCECNMASCDLLLVENLIHLRSCHRDSEFASKIDTRRFYGNHKERIVKFYRTINIKSKMIKWNTFRSFNKVLRIY